MCIGLMQSYYTSQKVVPVGEANPKLNWRHAQKEKIAVSETKILLDVSDSWK